MKIAKYETDITDAQWELLKPMLPQPSKRGRPQTNRRWVINAILYIAKGGIPWRMLPVHFPPWKTVFHIFRKWQRDFTWIADSETGLLFPTFLFPKKQRDLHNDIVAA